MLLKNYSHRYILKEKVVVFTSVPTFECVRMLPLLYFTIGERTEKAVLIWVPVVINTCFIEKMFTVVPKFHFLCKVSVSLLHICKEEES